MGSLSQNRWAHKLVMMVCAAGLCTPALPQTPGTLSVTAVRFWSLGEVTRVAIESSGAFEFKSDRLVNPDRVFFDLANTVPALERKGMTVIPVNDAFLRQIRVAETQRSTTRIVLDMQNTRAEISTSILENPDRLIIELRSPGSHAAPIANPVVSERTEPVSAAPVQASRPFHAPPAPSMNESYERHRQAVQLDPPGTIVGGHLAANAIKNDPLARMPLPIGPVPPPATAAAMRTQRTTPMPTPALASVSTMIPVQPAAKTIETAAPERIGLPAKTRTARDESMIRALGLKVGRIVIDAGHGGHDAGSSGPAGLKEKDLVLSVAQLLGELVEQRLGWEVIYTRSDDTFVPLEQRTAIANNRHADLFLSIHANSSSVRAATGIETYYLNFTTSRAALDVAARENATSEKTVYDLQDLLQKIALKDKVDESREFATRIQSSLFSMSSKTASRTRDRGVRKAPFVVLIGASMPSVLAEIGFISNPRDEALMKKAEYRQKMAEALYKGVAGYASTLSHFQVAQTVTQ